MGVAVAVAVGVSVAVASGVGVGAAAGVPASELSSCSMISTSLAVKPSDSIVTGGYEDNRAAKLFGGIGPVAIFVAVTAAVTGSFRIGLYFDNACDGAGCLGLWNS